MKHGRKVFFGSVGLFSLVFGLALCLNFPAPGQVVFPAFATAVGLVQYGASASERVYRSAEDTASGGVIDRFKRYLSEFF